MHTSLDCCCCCNSSSSSFSSSFLFSFCICVLFFALFHVRLCLFVSHFRSYFSHLLFTWNIYAYTLPLYSQCDTMNWQPQNNSVILGELSMTWFGLNRIVCYLNRNSESESTEKRAPNQMYFQGRDNPRPCHMSDVCQTFLSIWLLQLNNISAGIYTPKLLLHLNKIIFYVNSLRLNHSIPKRRWIVVDNHNNNNNIKRTDLTSSISIGYITYQSLCCLGDVDLQHIEHTHICVWMNAIRHPYNQLGAN